MNWSNFLEDLRIWFNEIIDWYLIQPPYGQILVIIGVVVLLALTITLVYYILKGIAYLIYYIIKGIYYVLKGIGYGFYKLFEWLYFLISGKSKRSLQKKIETPIQNEIIGKTGIHFEFCTECGIKVTEKMRKHLLTHGKVFCISCGNQFSIFHTNKPCSISQ
ncbi:MAG: hypothetical protein ACFFEY_03995 [Candidatus Thorarchaeota archaeon]